MVDLKKKFFVFFLFFKAGFKKPEICKILRHLNFRLGYLVIGGFPFHALAVPGLEPGVGHFIRP